MGLPVVRTGNVALDRFLEQVREYIETSKGTANPQSKDRVLRVSDLASVVALAAAGAQNLPKKYTQSELEQFASDLKNTRVFQSLMGEGSALDGVVDGLPRQTLADVRAARGTGVAAVVSEAIVSATETQVIAAQVSTVSASLTGLEGDVAAVETAYLAMASSVGGLEAQYTIKVRAGGAIAGIGLAASSSGEAGATSSVVISADKFAVVSAGSSGVAGAKVPFTINTGTGQINFTADVEIDGNLKVRGTGNFAHGSGFDGSLHASISGVNSSASSGMAGIYGYCQLGYGGFFRGGNSADNQMGVRAVGWYGVYGESGRTDGSGAGVYGQGNGATTPAIWAGGNGHFKWGSTNIAPPPGGTSNFLRSDGSWAAPTVTYADNAGYASSAGSATSASQLGGYSASDYLRYSSYAAGAPSGTAYTLYVVAGGLTFRIPAFYP